MKTTQDKMTSAVRSTARKLTTPLLALALLATAFGARSREDDGELKFMVPAALQVPAGNTLAFAARGKGVQKYAWSAAASAWVFVAPQANLSDDDVGIVGIHFAGPTWQNNDGSTVVGAKVASVTVDPTAIPWLLLKAANTTGPGVFADVTYVQRLHTSAGVAPAGPGTFDGQQVLVPYTALYLFYHAQSAQ